MSSRPSSARPGDEQAGRFQVVPRLAEKRSSTFSTSSPELVESAAVSFNKTGEAQRQLKCRARPAEYIKEMYMLMDEWRISPTSMYCYPDARDRTTGDVASAS